jgi:hypothetical protein
MGRALLLLAVLYHWGDWRLEAYRPAALDRPLRVFHHGINQAVHDARRVFATFDDAASMRYLTPLMRHLDTL